MVRSTSTTSAGLAEEGSELGEVLVEVEAGEGEDGDAEAGEGEEGESEDGSRKAVLISVWMKLAVCSVGRF